MKNILRCICKKNDYGYLTFFNIFSLSGMDSYFVKSYLRALIPSFFIALFMIFIGKPNLVPSMSMMPTIDELDFVYVNKIVYEISSPKRGDIITFDKDKYYVKRVIGMPGDTLSVKQGLVYINGERLSVAISDSPKLNHGYFETLTVRAAPTPVLETNPDGLQYSIFYSAKAKGEKGSDRYKNNLLRINYWANYEAITIPEGKYFVMGDNRMFSGDSRVFGLVDESEVVGRVSTVIFNLGAFSEIFTAIFTNEHTDNLFLFKSIAAS